MNQQQQTTINWIGRVLTWTIPIAAIIYQAGVQGEQINTLTGRVEKNENRIVSLQELSATATSNSYRLTRVDTTIDSLSQKRANDHDTLVRIDQTVQGMAAGLVDLKSDVKKLSQSK